MGPPRFNHVAMTVPVELLTGDGRRDVLDFYRDVFGWTEVTQMAADAERLVLSAHRFDQFVFLLTGDRLTQAAPMDHFGMAVDSAAELDGILDRAKTRATTDERVRVVDKTVEDYGPVVLTSCYIGFLLPLMVEVQHFAVTNA